MAKPQVVLIMFAVFLAAIFGSNWVLVNRPGYESWVSRGFLVLAGAFLVISYIWARKAV